MSSIENQAGRLGELIKRLRSLRLLRPPADCELPPGLVAILNWVSQTPGCGVLELADGLNVTPPTISVGVRSLVRDGWLERRQHPADRRAKPLFVTPKGETLLGHLHEFRGQVLRLFLAQLSENDQKIFLDLFEQAVSGMEDALLDNTWTHLLNE